MRYTISIALSAMLGVTISGRASAQESSRLVYNEHVRPILAANCFPCHGFDAKQRKADLRLDVPESALAEREGAFAIKPGEPDQSEVWRRISSNDERFIMPPAETKKSLTGAEKQTIKKWIEQGAKYQKHWSFEVPTKVVEPQVEQIAWSVNAVDRFILARLEREGLKPQKEADRSILIRRVAFALTGLPPTLAELDAFLGDSSPSAYGRMVDRYLNSPRFGEEMARHWLDIARYADTHGLHLDNERQTWAYRDWVVEAFNENLPFDQFTIAQLAGDLLPDADSQKLIATGFNRCNVTSSEGGSITEELIYRYAVDRASTMAQAWMGLTAGCAVCHDHKYDPLSMKEFYSLYAFFYSAADPGMDGNVRNTPPFLKVPSPEQRAAQKQADQDVAAASRQVEETLVAVEYVDPAEMSPPPARRVTDDTWIDDDIPFGARENNTSRDPAIWILNPEFGVKSGRRALELANTGQHDMTIQLPTVPMVIPNAGRLEGWMRIDPYEPPRVVAIQFDDGKVNRQIVWGDASGLKGDFQKADMGPLPPPGEWRQFVVPFDLTGMEPGTRVKSIVLIEQGGRVWLDAVRTVGVAEPAKDPLTSFVAWWRMSQSQDLAAVPSELRELVKGGPDKEHEPAQRDKLKRFYLTHVQRISDSPAAEARRAAERARFARLAIEDTIPGTFIFRNLDKPRDAFVMMRGQYNKPGEPVQPNVPAVFPPLELAPDSKATRLDLARWLVAPDHPLTARVTVNRLWQQFFGAGLVRTSDDFGTQGELPSHPELLDWLAVEFRESGWDVKGMVRLLLNSATFRQQAVVTPELLARDHDNRLLARGPRFRLDAEQIRDNALFVSGLIDLTMGGRGVRTYQPPNIWEPVGYENSNTRYYLQDHGASLYRRSLYCFLKRTAAPPFMSNFDGPNREQSCSRRERSNTPLQALQLMNDVQHFEAARALAERAFAHAGPSAADRIQFLYRVVLSRLPEAQELELVEQLVDKERGLFESDPSAARLAIEVGESPRRNIAPDPETAAWTIIANLILNLDETVTRN